MRSALVNEQTNIVENVIIADPSVDPAPNGYVIIGLSDTSPVSIGWIYDPASGTFTNPNPPPPESNDEGQ
jgi:hypothetical protein